jgi:hypothetical protein
MRGDWFVTIPHLRSLGDWRRTIPSVSRAKKSRHQSGKLRDPFNARNVRGMCNQAKLSAFSRVRRTRRSPGRLYL